MSRTCTRIGGIRVHVWGVYLYTSEARRVHVYGGYVYTFFAFAKLLIIRRLARGENVGLCLSEVIFGFSSLFLVVGRRFDLSKIFTTGNLLAGLLVTRLSA